MPDHSEEVQESVRKKSKNGVLLGISLVVIACLLVVVIVLLLNRDKPVITGGEGNTEPAVEETAQRDILVNEDNATDIVQHLEEETAERLPPGQFTVMMNFNWHFPTATDVSPDAYVANSMENTNDIYFDVFLPTDTDRIDAIYESPVIPLGNELTSIKLKKELEAGTYEDCVIVYHLVDGDQNTVSTASFALTIIIEG